MGLIYVNPEGPNGNPDPIASAKDIRETFFRMAMNDEETVALIAGGHTFGKTHGAGDPSLVGPEPEGGAIEDQGLGWKSKHGTGIGADAITGGPEVTWTQTPTQVEQPLLRQPVQVRMGADQEPGRRQAVEGQRTPRPTIPDAYDPSKKHVPTMLTSDLALRFDPAYEKISRRFYEHPEQFADAFARAWFKLTHRDMGPHRALSRPARAEGRADLAGPDPGRRSSADRRQGHRRAEGEDPRLRPSVSQLVSTAWASASTFRGSDKRGGANGARIRLAPQKDWDVNKPAATGEGARQARSDPEGVQRRRQEGLARRPDRSRRQRRDREGREGCRHRREGAVHAGPHGRVAGADRRCNSFAPLEPRADGFRNYISSKPQFMTPEEALVDRAQLLTLTAPEMTVLVGGLRVLGANAGDSKHGVFTKKAGHADQRLLRQPARHEHGMAAGRLEGELRRPRPQDQGGRSGPAPAST